MGPIKINNGGNYAHAHDSKAYNFCLELKFSKLIRPFIEQFLKGNSMGPIKTRNGRNYAHAQYSNAYNFC